MGLALEKGITPFVIRIAVIDDDESVRRALCRLLKTEGYFTRAFANAQEYLDARSQESFACLVLDIHLGGMSGLDLLEKLSGEGQRLPVVLITAHDDESTRVRACRSGAAAYLRKPLDAQVLEATISSVLASARTQRYE